jgi:hydroxyacylglutathione hydrolase
MPIVEPIPCLRDNYAYLIRMPGTTDAWLVDPSEPDAPARVLEERGLRLRGILATHHHVDHVGGVDGLVERFGEPIWVAGHAHDRGRIPRQTIFADVPTERFAPTDVEIGGVKLVAAHIPGHTLGAIAWCIPATGGESAIVFTGDTLFAAGCGRLFEGTPAQMHASLHTICALPGDTRLYFGHEYTASNLRFAKTVEPDNAAIDERAHRLASVTTPTTVALEQATNPFVRAKDVAELGARRQAKDRF